LIIKDKVIIGLSYSMYTGKTTAANYLVKNYGFVKVSFANKLKETVKDLYNLTDEQTKGKSKEIPIVEMNNLTPRDIMQKFGESNRKIYCPVWINYVFQKTIPSLSPASAVVIDDCRYKNEADKIKEYGGVVINILRDTGMPKGSHSSEIDLDGYVFDYVIENNGTKEDFYRKIDSILYTILPVNYSKI